MTNNTIPNVPRELLEELRDAANESMNATTRQHQIDHFAGLIAKVDALLSASSPAGVDGLEVVRKACEAANCKYPEMDAMADFKRDVTPSVVIGLLDGIRHAKGIAAINDARANGCAETAQFLRLELSDATAIIDGLRGEVERIRLNIAEYNEAIACYQSERDQQAQRIGELEGLLRHAQKQVPTGSGLHMRIDAALSAVCAAAPNIAPTSEHSGS